MFKDRFAPLVRSGQKLQTIRPIRKRPILTGDLLSLRRWTGKAYRSKQEELAVGRCLAVCWITIGCPEDSYPDGILIDGIRMDTAERAAIARADGFSCMTGMLDWFENEHGLPFAGIVIRWRLVL